jgi:hypothetical protein
MQTPDVDAKRWRLFVKRIGEIRARPDGYRHIFWPLRQVSETPVSNLQTVQEVKVWKIEISWMDLSGGADTIPKFIDQCMKEEQEKGAS